MKLKVHARKKEGENEDAQVSSWYTSFDSSSWSFKMASNGGNMVYQYVEDEVDRVVSCDIE